MDPQLRSNIATVTAAFNGAKIDKQVTDAITETERVADAAANLASPNGMMAVAIADAIGRGIDPGDDEAVRRLVIVNAIADGARTSVPDVVYGQLQETLRAAADGIISAWQTPFTAAAGVLDKASEVIRVPLTDAPAILRSGADGAGHWVAAREAVAAIERISAAWDALGVVTRLVPRNPQLRSLRIASPTIEQIDQLNLDAAKVDVWALVSAGVPLSLPSFAEYGARMRAINDARGRRAAEAEQANRDRMLGRQRRPVGTDAP